MTDLDPGTLILLCSLIWGGLVVHAVHGLSDRAHGTTGIPFAFIGIYTAMHIGALVHLVPGYDHTLDPGLASWQYTRDTVGLGLEASTLAMIAATIGFSLAETLATRFRRPPKLDARALERLLGAGKVMLAAGTAGLAVEKILDLFGIDAPGLQAILGNARNLIVAAGGCIVLHQALTGKSTRAMILAAAFAIALPAVYLITTAILADSICAGMACFAFYLTIRSQTGSVYLGNLAIVALLFVSGFVFSAAYLENRDALRDILWKGGSVGTAAGQVADVAGKYDVGNATQLAALYAFDSRLDQNIFVGLAIEKLRTLPDTYENGDTIVLALLGWVPRFMWPGKPERGGSTLIEKHTTKRTDGGTTFGAGPIFEFYVNFAYWGVFFGFVVLGLITRLFDIKAARALSRSQHAGFAPFYLAGLAMLQPLADLFFIVTSVVAALLVGWAIGQVLGQPGVRRAMAG